MNLQRTIHKQLIDDDKNFHRESMENVAKVLQGVDKSYYSVAIIGVQNSGKSTLLNHVFGTNFDVLKEIAGSRTTRGILTSVDKEQNIIIYDVEGNDAMDRSEEQDYQKMVATYALVTANVLIINIWGKSLGQYTGSQYETLKVIMEICMDQFKQQSPKTILYCVRDFNADYDDEGEIRRKIIRDVNDIWRKLEKSQEMHAYDNKPQKFFNIEVCVLSRYREGKVGKFNEDIAKLRERFVNPKDDGYIFAHQKTQYNLPITDLPTLSETSWATIKSNKKLNLPSQKQQLANFRCSTIMNQVESRFEQQIKTYEDSRKSTDFGKMKQKYLSQYDSQAYHYGKNVVEAKRAQLITGIDDHLKKTVNVQVQLKINELSLQFTEKAKNCKFEQNNTKSLDDTLKELINNFIEDLIRFMKEMNYQIPDRKHKIQELTQKLNNSFNQTKATILKLAHEEFQNQSSRNVRFLASEVIKNHFGQQFWEHSWNSFNSSIGSLVEKYRIKYVWITGDELNPIQYDLIEQKITQQFKDSVRGELQKTFTNKIMDYFTKLYNHNQDGDRISFNLKTEEQIGTHFDVTRDKVILLIRKINLCNRSSVKRASLLEGMDDDASFFQSTWLSNTTEMIDKNMRNQYEKTIRRKKQGEMNTVPVWLYLIIFFFVYDDLWFSAEESPILHYTFVGILLLVTLLIAIGQGKIITQVIRIITDKLKERFEFLR